MLFDSMLWYLADVLAMLSSMVVLTITLAGLGESDSFRFMDPLLDWLTEPQKD